jgi:hypothetical protein
MKRFLRPLVILCALLVPFVSQADIGENFSAAGATLGGTVAFDVRFGSIENPVLSYYHVGASPWLGFFLVDNLSLSIGASFEMWDYPTDPLYMLRWTAGGSASLTRYFVGTPEASTGLVSSISVGTSIGYDGYYENAWVNLYPGVAVYYFISQRVAPYVSLSGIGVGLGLLPGPIYFYDWLSPSLRVGVTWFIPSRDRAMF